MLKRERERGERGERKLKYVTFEVKGLTNLMERFDYGNKILKNGNAPVQAQPSSFQRSRSTR